MGRPLPPRTPTPLVRAIERALAPDPAARLAVDDLAAALRAALDCDHELARRALATGVGGRPAPREHRPVEATSPRPTFERPREPRR